MASYGSNNNVKADETTHLISASKVQGTAIYNADGEDAGTLYDVMIEKVSGKVSYAVMSIGGFLGMGADYHPVPWTSLKYDSGFGGYVLAESVDRLKGGPTMGHDYATDPDWERKNAGWSERVDDYYGVRI